jgi:hypothetical protein
MMTWAFHDSPEELSPAQLVLLLALCDAANDDGWVVYLPEEQQSQEGLALKARMSRRTLQRQLDALGELGIVEKSRESVLDTFTYRVVASGWRNGKRQDDAPGSVTMTHRTSYDGVNGVSRAKPKTTQAHALPADWKPNAAHVMRATSMGVDVDLEAEAFRAHAEAHGRTAKVWDAAFTQWILHARPTVAAAPTRAEEQVW